MDALLTWWPVVSTVANLLVLWIAWSLRRIAAQQVQDVAAEMQREMKDMAATMHERLNVHAERLTRAEGRIDSAPDHEDLKLIHGRVSEVKNKVFDMAADIAATRADVGGLKRSMEILIQHQLAQEERK